MSRKIEITRIEPTRLSHYLSLLGAIVLGFYILGYGSGIVAFIGSTLLALPLVLSLYLRYTLVLLKDEIQVKRSVIGKPVEGYYTPVKLTVSNGSRLGLFYATINDSPPEGLRVKGLSGGGGVLPPRSEIDILYYVIPRIGLREFGGAKITIWDPLGLVTAEASITPSGSRFISGYPSKAIAYDMPELKPVVDPYISPSSRLIRGPGIEIYTIREFVQGDEPRLIDWKATARLGRLFVKELRREAEIPLMIAVALSSQSNIGEPYKTPFEMLLRAAYILGEQLVSRGSSITYIALTGRSPVKTPMGRGKEGISRLQDAIAVTPPPRENAPYGLFEIVKHIKATFPGKGIVLILVDEESKKRLHGIVSSILEMKHRVYYMEMAEGAIKVYPVKLAPQIISGRGE
ncbi:MAG: DUF58 domain-containing protein [Desulfurococcales archaeon]|nr:DUF58 domain-containing protein [Desulfurococcales archaeon]MEB3789127.1 DUF58 domain-containing protein [Desulfurococcales archaeon]